jgi:hypothetical protein
VGRGSRQREDLYNGVATPVTPRDGSESGKVTITDVLIHDIGKDKDMCVVRMRAGGRVIPPNLPVPTSSIANR